MATPLDVDLVIPGEGYVYVGAVDATPPTLGAVDQMDLLSPAAQAPGFSWIGDTSYETPIEFESDGGDSTRKRSWARQNLRNIREAVANSATISSINISRESFELAYPGSKRDAETGVQEVYSNGRTSERSVLIVWQDGSKRGGLYFPNTDIAGNFPTFDHEEFMEIPLSVAILSSKKKAGFEWGRLGYTEVEKQALADLAG